MIVINIKDINVKSMSDNSGVFVGSNFDPNWDTFTKSNTNISGNNNKNNLNIIIDQDGLDFVVADDQDANQVTITDDNDTRKIIISKKKRKHGDPSNNSLIDTPSSSNSTFMELPFGTDFSGNSTVNSHGTRSSKEKASKKNKFKKEKSKKEKFKMKKSKKKNKKSKKKV